MSDPEVERLRLLVRHLTQERDDWKLRFKDRDAYAKLLEAELAPLRREQIVGQHEQGVLA
jgi:hypothetical protein